MLLTVNIVDEVIKYAKVRETREYIFSQKYFPHGGSVSQWNEKTDTAEYKDSQDARTRLNDYLNSLGFDVIKELQVLMYLGRDDAYNEEPNGMKRFQKYYDCFNSQGWNSKSIEINQIMEKLPLANYLEKGKEIIGW